jgi:hypothetical protein
LGLRDVEVTKIVGSVDRHEAFDRSFMPTKASLAEKWKRVDRAFHRGIDLPAVRLYKMGDRTSSRMATTASASPVIIGCRRSRRK